MGNQLVERVRLLLVQYDPVGVEDPTGYADEARCITCCFGEVESAGEMTLIVQRELRTTFAGLVGDDPEECRELSEALWELRCRPNA